MPSPSPRTPTPQGLRGGLKENQVTLQPSSSQDEEGPKPELPAVRIRAANPPVLGSTPAGVPCGRGPHAGHTQLGNSAICPSFLTVKFTSLWRAGDIMTVMTVNHHVTMFQIFITF